MPLTAVVLESRLLNEIAPGDISRFYQILTESEEKLLNAGRWEWTRTLLALPVVDNMMYLPAQYDSIVGARIGDYAKAVKWQEIEYWEEAPGVIPLQGCDSVIVDQGWVDTSDSSDEDGRQRCYKVTGEDLDYVSVLARYASKTYAVENPNEQMLCPVFAAHKRAMLSIVFENANDSERALAYFQMALRDLDDKESAYRGSAKQIFKQSMFMPLPYRSRTNFP